MNLPRLTTHYAQQSNYSVGKTEKHSLGPVLSRVYREHDGQEARVLNELMVLDEAYRGYFQDWRKELDLQRMAADKLCQLTKDYSVLFDTNCRNPQNVAIETDEAIVNKYQVHYQIILSSNLAMNRGLTAIRQNLLAFRRECNKVDLNEMTPLVAGDAFHKPLKFFIALAEDLFNYFHCGHLKLDNGSRHLDPSDTVALEAYRKMLLPCEEFEEYLLHNLSYCNCLRVEQMCKEMPATRSHRESEIDELMKRAKQKRCAQRQAKMSKKMDESMSHSLTVSLEHELRMNQLSMRLAQLRQTASVRNLGHERDLVEQMIYALSPSLMANTFRSLDQNQLEDLTTFSVT